MSSKSIFLFLVIGKSRRLTFCVIDEFSLVFLYLWSYTP